jgi:hypothetical protein
MSVTRGVEVGENMARRSRHRFTHETAFTLYIFTVSCFTVNKKAHFSRRCWVVLSTNKAPIANLLLRWPRGFSRSTLSAMAMPPAQTMRSRRSRRLLEIKATLEASLGQVVHSEVEAVRHAAVALGGYLPAVSLFLCYFYAISMLSSPPL